MSGRYDTHIEHGGGGNTPHLIVLHAMGEVIKYRGVLLHAVKFLDKVGLSAHALGAPDGSVYRCRKDRETAWHAKGFNANSLGYEFLVAGDHDYASFLEAMKTSYVTEAQYQAGLEQVREWLDLYPIRRIARHSDLSPERKVDPGTGFPWRDFIYDLGAGDLIQ